MNSLISVQERPAALNMPDQAVRFVLGCHADVADTGIHAIGQREIDDAELAAERNCRLGTPLSELMKTTTTPPCQHHRIRFFGNTTDETRR